MPVLAWLLRGRNNSNTTFGPRVLNSGVWGYGNKSPDKEGRLWSSWAPVGIQLGK